jgi:hypothetical protein
MFSACGVMSHMVITDDHVTVFSLLGDVIHQQAENRQILV